ncbi:MAG TPA: (deoxy)nucleoside triphosphate pyrophosphohydrolase [Steroidobacteraceae bacterium]|nr:(deoxy)nucleoside triphosphate pyrophosphohydrolase [Steroidobacteraceae bacterium]
MALKVTHVVAGALFDDHGRVLIAQRPPGKHMAGGWEFPGGKLEAGEDRFDGLRRELIEEIGIEISSAEPLIAYEHLFADRAVFLDLWWVNQYSGVPQSLDSQALRWVYLHELEDVGLLEADRPMIPALISRASHDSKVTRHE